MMKLLAALLGLLLLTACADSPEANFFILDPEPPARELPAAGGAALFVDTVRIPDYLDRPELVRRIGMNRLDISGVNRWGSRLGIMIREVLIQNLADRLPQGMVLMEAPPFDGIAYRVLTMRVNDFAAGPEEQVILDVAWSVVDGEDRRTEPRRTERIVINLQGPGPSAQARGMSRALGLLTDRIVSRLSG